jgi:hypothetical protein
MPWNGSVALKREMWSLRSETTVRLFHRSEEGGTLMSGNNAKADKKALFSTAWIFATLNYLYCDLISLMDPLVLKQFLEGSVGDLRITPAFLLGASVLMEIPISMAILSRLLKHGANRWANIISGAVMTLVQCASLFFGSEATLYYAFFSVIEITCTVLIVWFAIRWKPVDETA